MPSKHKRVFIARTLLLVMLYQTFHALFIPEALANNPVSDQLRNYVNPFTGDFNYGIPLISVPGPNGENVPVSLGYMGGIRMEQEASWVGLGWDLNPGEVIRSVNGMPDDYRGDLVYFIEKGTGGNMSVDYTSNYFGPVHFKEYNTASLTEPGYLKGMDIYKSNRFLEGTNKTFQFPDYDNYFVSGPGIGGEMSLHLFEYKTLMHTELNDGDLSNRFSDTQNPFTKRPEFVFKNEIAPKAKAHFDYIGAWASIPEDENQTTTDANFRFPHTFTDFAYSGVNSYNRPNSGNYIEYFTNEQLSVSLPAGFLDHKAPAAPRSSAAVHPPQAIGAFRITDTRGYIYHYSLPVYAFDEASYSFTLDSTGNVDLSSGKLSAFIKSKKYASSWKLTAVTGPDYEDLNNNNAADAGDKGYWISYDYGLWTSDFAWRSPFYGFTSDIMGSVMPPITGTTVMQETYKRSGSVASGHSQKYYLNSIRTATHVAYFIKEARADAHSKDVSTPHANRKYKPELRLNKIVLMRTGDGTLVPNGTDAFANPNGFDLSACNTGQVLHMGNYNAQKAQIDQASLKTAELTFDYSLCRGIFNNANNIILPDDPYYVTLTDQPTAFLYENVASRISLMAGRLTLKSVKMLERGYVQIFPTHELSYAKNRDYLHNGQDVWGFCKSDYAANRNGIYTTPDSKSHTDTWSLTGITTPAGAVISVEYESDSYEKVGNTPKGKPQRIFLVKSDTRTVVSGERKHKLGFHDADIQEFLDGGMEEIGFLMPYELLPNDDSCNAESGCVYGTDPFYEYNIFSYSSGPSAGSYSHFTYDASGKNISDLSLLKCECYKNCPYPVENYDTTRVLAYAYITPRVAYGGGLRVKSLSIKESESNKTYRSDYFYSGGFATVEPDRFSIRDFKKLARSNVTGDRHTFTPGVGYSNVTVKTIGANGAVNGSTEFAFYNYTETLQPYYNEKSTILQINGQNITNFYEGISIEDDNSMYGQLLMEKVYDNNGNLLMQTTNEYSQRDDDMSGVIDEAFNCNTVASEAHTSNYAKRISQRYLTKVTTVKDHIVTSTLMESQDMDPVSGKPKRVNTTDYTRSGNSRTSMPAYEQHPAMGSKVSNPANRNILEPSAKEALRGANSVFEAGSRSIWDNVYSYRVFSNASGKYVTQSSSSGGYWYPRLTRVYDGLENDTTWKVTGQVTLLDDLHKRVLEQKGVKRYSASKYGYNNLYRIAEVQNANYSSFAFSSFEDQLTVNASPSVIHFGGEVEGGEKRVAAGPAVPAHTGDFLFKLSPNQTGARFYSEVNDQTIGGELFEKGLQTGRVYRASVWVHALSSPGAQLVATLNGIITGSGPVTATVTRQMDEPQNVIAGSWTLLTLEIEVPAGLNNGSSLTVYLNNPASYSSLSEESTPVGTVSAPVPNLLDAYYDDMNLHPVDAPVTGYVYDEKTGWLRAMLDNENFAVFYEYDAAGRLVFTKKETVQGIRNVSSTIYHNAR